MIRHIAEFLTLVEKAWVSMRQMPRDAASSSFGDDSARADGGNKRQIELALFQKPVLFAG
jgi:hypothetical protein